MKEATPLTYETAQAELQQIVQQLQAGQLSLDDLSVQMTRAAELLDYCQERLRATEERLEGLFPEPQ